MYGQIDWRLFKKHGRNNLSGYRSQFRKHPPSEGPRKALTGSPSDRALLEGL
jgi:hypothetical protein